MAGKHSPTSLVDREGYRMILGEARSAGLDLGEHVRNCAACTRAHRTGDPFAWCDQGWPLIKAHTRAQHALDNARIARREPQLPGQGELF